MAYTVCHALIPIGDNKFSRWLSSTSTGGRVYTTMRSLSVLHVRHTVEKAIKPQGINSSVPCGNSDTLGYHIS